MGHTENLAALHELLNRLFAVGELRRFVALLSDAGDLELNLPGPTASQAEETFAIVRGLDARGLLGQRFFDHLRTVRGQRMKEIDAVESRFRHAVSLARSSDDEATDAPRFEGPHGGTARELRDFIGRGRQQTELERLLYVGSVDCVVVSGSGGIGKTTLVEQFVATRAPACFPDGVSWLDGRTLPTELIRVCRQFGWSDQREPTVEKAKRWLAKRLGDRRYLFVIDDFEPDGDPGLLPVLGGRCRTLITTQKSTLHSGLPSAAPLPLTPWSREESLLLLRQPGLRRDRDSDDERNSLAEFVGDLPIAVRLVACYLENRPGTSASDVLAELRRQPLATLEKYRGTYRGLAETFQATWNTLDETHRRVMQTLAACARDTRTWIVRAVANVGEPGEVLDQLVTRSLAQLTVASESFWSLHEVVRMFVSAQPGFRDTAQSHAEWAIRFMQENTSASGSAAFNAVVPEALQAFHWSLGEGVIGVAQAIYRPLSGYLFHVGRFAQCAVLTNALLKCCPPVSALASRCLHDLGCCDQNLGEIQRAIECHKRGLTIDEQLGRSKGQAMHLGRLGSCLRALGHMNEAMDYHKRALSIYEQTGDLAGRAMELGSLGNCHAQLGWLRSAIPYILQALEINETLQRPSVQAENLASLGMWHIMLHEFQTAREYLEHSLAIYMEIDRPTSRAQLLEALAVCFRGQGDIPKAIEYLLAARAILDELKLWNHQASVFGELGTSYLMLGEIEHAISFHQRALEIYVQGGILSGQASTLCNIGACYRRAGKIHVAIDFFKRALALDQKLGRLGEAATHLTNLGWCYRQLGDPLSACEHWQCALEIYGTMGLSDSHPSVAKLLKALAELAG